MSGQRLAGGLPPGSLRQVGERGIAAAPAPRVAACEDPNVLAIARAVGCAIREARPVVTLPPHVSIPWRGFPLFVETRRIVDGSGDATVAAGASNASEAEGIELATQDAASAFVEISAYTVPTGKVAVMRRLGFATDEGGYYVNPSLGTPVVSFQVQLGGRGGTLLPIGRLGVAGTLEQPLEVAYLVPQDQAIVLRARSEDTASWHLCEAFWEGWLIDVQDIDDTLRSLVPEAFCGGREGREGR